MDWKARHGVGNMVDVRDGVMYGRAKMILKGEHGLVGQCADKAYI